MSHRRHYRKQGLYSYPKCCLWSLSTRSQELLVDSLYLSYTLTCERSSLPQQSHFICRPRVGNQTVRTDFILLSTYEVHFGKERFKDVGIFRNFILLEKPDLRRFKTEDSPAG